MPTVNNVDHLRRCRFQQRPPHHQGPQINHTAATTPQPNQSRTAETSSQKVNGLKRSHGEQGASSISEAKKPKSRRHLNYTEVLLQPELLKDLKGHEDLLSSSNPLLELCLDSGDHLSSQSSIKRSASPFTASCMSAKSSSSLSSSRPLPPLLQCCSSVPFDNQSLLELVQICQKTNNEQPLSQKENLVCDINARDSRGLTALHLLIKGCSKESFIFTLHAIYILLSLGADPHAKEASSGDTPLTKLQRLLAQELFEEATLIAQVLCAAKADTNHMNQDNRTLLSYSVTYGDLCAPLTRMLLNFGARVWPGPDVSTAAEDVIDFVARDREQSAFTWFLRSLIEGKTTSMDMSSETIYLLGTAMSIEPARMRSHVSRTMLHLGRCARALGPLFNELKAKLTPFWARPQTLKLICLQKIRSSIGPKNLSDQGRLNSLDLPFTIMQFLQLF